MKCVYFILALVACTALAVTNTTMPSYYAVGSNARELGVSIGVQQREAFQKLLKADDSLITVLRPWMEKHKKDYEAFCEANKNAYPDIYEEIIGIAHGAKLNESDTILLMLRPEIESLVAAETGRVFNNDNCFDIINNPKGSEGTAFIAHNEDWTPAYKPFGFVLHENMPFSRTGATHITAFTYPASPVGFTFGYNDKGVVTSCNGLNPKPCRAGKLGRYFINRDVLAATSVDDAIERLKKAAPEAALGFGMSIGSVGSRKLYHAEMAPYDPSHPSENGHVDIIEILPGESYLHSNSYTHNYFKNINQYTSQSTVNRLARAAEMERPTNPKLALAILGDEKNKRYPIYRYGDPNDTEELATISTALLDLDNAVVSIYGGNPTKFDPVVVMPLFNPVPSESAYGTPFIVAVCFAGIFGLLAFILIVLLIVKNKRTHRLVVNSGYDPVA